MGQEKILIEHYYNGKLVRKISSSKIVFEVGSHRNAEIVCRAIDSAPFSAKVEYANGKWLWTEGEQTKSSAVGCFEFSHHKLNFSKVEAPSKVFAVNEPLSNQGTEFHQVVVYRSSHILDSELLPLNQSFSSEKFGIVNLPAATSTEWKITAVDDYEVWQRNVQLNVPSYSSDGFKHKKNFIVAICLLAVLFFSGLLFSPGEEDIPETVPQNKYTKMIYSQEEFKRSRMEAAEMLKEHFSIEKAVVSSTATQKSSWSSSEVKKAISDIKNSKLRSTLKSIIRQSSFSLKGIQALKGPVTDKASLTDSIKKELGRSIKTGSKSFKLATVGGIGKGLGRDKIQQSGIGGSLKGAKVGGAQVKMFYEETIVDGGLDPEQISKVIRQHLGEVRYCYERQLRSDPDLSGKVQLKFSIDARGVVGGQKIGTTTLKNAMVEGCILRRVARWKFPNPRGGTTVRVTYPFVLKTIR